KELIDLSIRRPWLGRNRLVERLLDDPAHYKAYRGHLDRLLTSGLAPDRLRADLKTMQAMLAPHKEAEKKAASKRGDALAGWLMGLMLGKATDLETFIAKRSLSVKDQLAGKSAGTVLKSPWGMGGGPDPMPLLGPVLKHADTDGDGQLSKDEALTGVKAL